MTLYNLMTCFSKTNIDIALINADLTNNNDSLIKPAIGNSIVISFDLHIINHDKDYKDYLKKILCNYFILNCQNTVINEEPSGVIWVELVNIIKISTIHGLIHDKVFIHILSPKEFSNGIDCVIGYIQVTMVYHSREIFDGVSLMLLLSY